MFTNSTATVLQVNTGMLSLLDIVTGAFLRQSSSSYYVLTAVQQMPKMISSNAIITQMINILGSTLFPLSLSLLLPIFMYSIVLEKEDKLI